MKRRVGDNVRINPYSEVTGVIIGRRDETDENYGRFDYKVKLNIPHVSKDTVYTANYNESEKYWWQYFDDEELDILERNYSIVTSKV